MSNHQIDQIDRKILTQLMDDGRMTNQDLSERVGLSPSPCLRRLKALEAQEIIFRYVALVDPEDGRAACYCLRSRTSFGAG